MSKIKNQIKYIAINKLIPLANNPRLIKDKQFKTLCKSIKENPKFFEARPIIVSNRTGKMVIIGGNQRWRAAKEIGLKKVPVYIFNNLTKKKEQEITIRDNVQNGEWDFDLLENEFNIQSLNEWGIDLQIQDSVPKEEIEIKAYKKIHILISIPIEKIEKFNDIMDKIKTMDGIEYEQSQN